MEPVASGIELDMDSTEYQAQIVFTSARVFCSSFLWIVLCAGETSSKHVPQHCEFLERRRYEEVNTFASVAHD